MGGEGGKAIGHQRDKGTEQNCLRSRLLEALHPDLLDPPAALWNCRKLLQGVCQIHLPLHIITCNFENGWLAAILAQVLHHTVVTY